MRPLLLALVVAGLVTAGCVGLPGKDDRPTLRILDQGSFAQFDKVKPIFEDQTGARLERIEGEDAGQALAVALQGAGNPPADILFGVDQVLFVDPRIRDTSLFVPYESPNLARIDASVVDLDMFRVEGELWATPVEHGYIAVNYDVRLRERYAEHELPRTLRDLATAAWGPKFVTSDPRFSSPGLGFLLCTIATFPEGSAYDWRDYWDDLFDNGTRVAKDWTQAYVYHYSGGYGAYEPEQNALDRNVVVSYHSSPAVEVLFGAESPPGVSMEPHGGVFHQVETMGILRGTKNLDLAKAFLDFMLTDAFQSLNAPENAVYPVVRNVTLPAPFVEHATDPSRLRPAHFSQETLAANLERWLLEWEDLYQDARS